MTPWVVKAREFVNCNCSYGCPCQFNALPTYGDCRTVAAFDIVEGRFGDVTLDGLKAVQVLQWPGAIHEGRGKGLLIVDERADAAQRAALATIVSGQETEPGATVWNVFAATLETVLDPLFKPIRMEIDVAARTGRVVVDGLVEMLGEPIRNPVTGAEHRVRIDMPNGFSFRLAEIGSGSSKVGGPIPFTLHKSYGQFADVHLTQSGVVG
ncbi:MAG: DUF1326 domain-containing protein [Hyphomicrobiaceae bacterium]